MGSHHEMARYGIDAMLEVGTDAPDFSVPNQDGQGVTLESLRGHWVALWWYPMASTPG